MSKSLAELFGSEVVMGSPSLGIVGGDNGTKTEEQESPQALQEKYKYFVSYWTPTRRGDLLEFRNAVVWNSHPIEDTTDIHEIEGMIWSKNGEKPVLLWWREM